MVDELPGRGLGERQDRSGWWRGLGCTGSNGGNGRRVQLGGRWHFPERASAEGALAKFVAAHLPVDRGELVDEDDLAGYLLVREHLRDVLAELGLELLRACCAGFRHDERADELPSALQVTDADNRRSGDGRVPREHALDVERPERPAGARDDVLRAADEREEALLVGMRDVAGEVPVAEEGGLRLLGLFPVPGEQGGWAASEGEIALDAGRELVALVVDDRDVMAGQRTADRAGLRGTIGEIRDHDVRLGLAVAVVDSHAPPLLEHGDDLGVEEISGRDEAAEAWGAEPLELRVLRHDAVLGGGVAENARTEPEEEVEAFVGVELALVEHDFRAARPWADDGVPHRQRGGRVRRAPHRVPAPDVEPMLGLDASGEDGSMGVGDVLARAGGTGRRDDEGEVARGGVVRGNVDRDVLRVPSHPCGVELVVGGEAHLLDRRLEGVLRDHQRRVRRRHDALEPRRGHQRRAWHDDGSRLHDSENGLEPVDGAVRNDDDAVADADAALAKCGRPDGCALGDLQERSGLDHAVLGEDRERAPLRIPCECLDDVAREVEPVGNLPAAVDERRPKRELQRRAGQLVRARPAFADANAFHDQTIIDPKWSEAEPESRDCGESGGARSRRRARARTARPPAAAREDGIRLLPRAPQCVCGSVDAC